jgi:hypothetical protein
MGVNLGEAFEARGSTILTPKMEGGSQGVMG